MKQRTHCKDTMKNDLMQVYRQVTATYDCRTQAEAYELTINHEAPRFYVDARWAHQRIAPLTRGDHSGLEKLSPLAREMYEALFDVVMRLSQKEKYWGKSLYYILQFAILEPAPRFYISPSRMGQIWLEKTRSRIKQGQMANAEA